MSESLRKALSTEPPMQASKWLKVQVLLDNREMQALLSELGEFHIYMTSMLSSVGEAALSKKIFIEQYSHYVDQLKHGLVPNEKLYRSYFSSVFTLDLESLYSVPIGDQQEIIRVAKPVIQLQMHKLSYSEADGKFHTMSFGHDGIMWGIQFSYPQLFQDPSTQEICSVINAPDAFPNSRLFQALQRWIRENTIPTPLVVEGKLINLPVRLGKLAHAWINIHPQLIAKNMMVK